MQDFIHDEDTHYREQLINRTYNAYKRKYRKVYEDDLDEHKRKNIFHHNLR